MEIRTGVFLSGLEALAAIYNSEKNTSDERIKSAYFCVFIRFMIFPLLKINKIVIFLKKLFYNNGGLGMKYPTTSKTLLGKLCSGDEVSWEEFYAKYRDIILFAGGLHGLREAEQEELLQRVMGRFFKNSKTFIFNPELARFRTYLGTIIKNCAMDILNERPREMFYELPENLAAPNSRPDWELDREFQEKWKKLVLEEAMEELKNRVDLKTYQAFELYAMQNRPVEKVAIHLDMKPAQLYLAKTRCLKILKEIIAGYGEDGRSVNV